MFEATKNGPIKRDSVHRKEAPCAGQVGHERGTPRAVSTGRRQMNPVGGRLRDENGKQTLSEETSFYS